jgi:hypothetical protein
MADKKSGPTAEDIMSPAEMKPLLTKSKQGPVSCAIGLTKSKEGIILLDIKLKPKQLLAELKKKAAKLKLELDVPFFGSVRRMSTPSRRPVSSNSSSTKIQVAPCARNCWST